MTPPHDHHSRFGLLRRIVTTIAGVLLPWIICVFVCVGLIGVCGCSKRDPAKPRATSLLHGADTDVGRCSSECHKAHPTGAAKLRALDDCVSTTCQVPNSQDEARREEDLSRDCSAIAAANSKDKLSYGYAPVNACIARACCDEATACQASRECALIVECINECNGSL